MIHVAVFSSILAATCGYALWRGGAPERAAAIFFAVGFLATYALPFDKASSFHRVERGNLLVDLAMLVALLAISLRANRFWPMWVAAVQLLAVAIHGVKAYDPTLVAWLYNVASGKISYPMVAMLAIGVARHRERITAYGSDPDWSPWHREAFT